MHSGPLTHERARELATNAIDFDLSAAEWEQLDGHFANCEPCRRFAAATRRDQARLASLPLRDAPPRIHEALRRAEVTKRDRTRPFLVLAAAAMAGALAFVTLGGGSQPKPADSPLATAPNPSVAVVPASPTTAPTSPPATAQPSVETPTEAPRLPVAWGPVGDQTSFHDPYGDMEAVAAGKRLVAVGDGCGASLATCHVAIWTSDDGATWARIQDGPEFRAGPYIPARRGELTDVVATDSGYLAVGRSRESGTRRAVVFWSNDGLSWTRSRDDASLLLGTMEAVVETPIGFVAVGNVVEETIGHASAWTSPDGLAWVRTTGDSAAFEVGGNGSFSDGRMHGGMIDVVWTGTGAVALGSACDVDGSGCRGVAWTSSNDGRSWKRVSTELAGTPYAMAVGDEGIVAVGDDGAGHPLSWISEDDGATWAPGQPVAGYAGNFDGVIATPGGLVASIATTGLASAVATSTDGLSWQIAVDPGSLGPGVVNGLTWDPVRRLAIGVGWDGQTPAAAVWLGR